MRRLIVAAVLLGSALTAGQSLAQPARIVDDDPQNADYTVEFFNDNLTAEGHGATGVLLKIRSAAVRRTLIRPRTSFVAALLKTVETL